METLASATGAPANAENTATADTGEADANPVEATGDGSAPSAPEAGTPAPKDRVQERIDTLTREKYDALRERDRKDYEIERLRAEVAKFQEAPAQQVAPANDFPTLEQYGYDEGKYQAAVASHISKIAQEQGTAAAREAFNAEKQRQQAEQANQSWAQKEAELIKSKPDYVEKVQQAATLPISQEIQQALKGHELGPQIALHMVENAEASRAILRLPLPLQLMEVGRIAAKIEAAKAAPKPAVSQAPAPIPKVDADESPTNIRVDTADGEQLSDKEWARRRNLQEQARIRKARGGS